MTPLLRDAVSSSTNPCRYYRYCSAHQGSPPPFRNAAPTKASQDVTPKSRFRLYFSGAVSCSVLSYRRTVYHPYSCISIANLASATNANAPTAVFTELRLTCSGPITHIHSATQVLGSPRYPKGESYAVSIFSSHLSPIEPVHHHCHD
jgi:hypothetical protein